MSYRFHGSAGSVGSKVCTRVKEPSMDANAFATGRTVCDGNPTRLQPSRNSIVGPDGCHPAMASGSGSVTCSPYAHGFGGLNLAAMCAVPCLKAHPFVGVELLISAPAVHTPALSADEGQGMRAVQGLPASPMLQERNDRAVDNGTLHRATPSSENEHQRATMLRCP